MIPAAAQLVKEFSAFMEPKMIDKRISTELVSALGWENQLTNSHSDVSDTGQSEGCNNVIPVSLEKENPDLSSLNVAVTVV
jgi:hypothetical protein